MDKYTHGDWKPVTDKPSGSTQDAYLVLLFDPTGGDTAVELLVYRNNVFYGVPDSYEVIGWYPYNPSPLKLSEWEQKQQEGERIKIKSANNDNVIQMPTKTS